MIYVNRVIGKALGKSHHNNASVHLRSMDIDDQLPAFHRNNSNKRHDIHQHVLAYNRRLDGFQIRYDCVHSFICMDFPVIICYSFVTSGKAERRPCPIRLMSNISFFGIRNSRCLERFKRNLGSYPRVSSTVPKSIISCGLFVATISSDAGIRYSG